MICLVGIDGSGKTAHAREFFAAFRGSGKACRYEWLGSASFISFPFMALCRLLGYTQIHNLPGGQICAEHHYYKNKAIATMWPWIRLVDLMIFTLLRVYIALWQGFIVVCDRFVHDTLVETMVDTHSFNLHRKLVGRLILRLKPQCAEVFLLDIDEATALRRKKDIPHSGYLSLRRKSYRLIAAALRIPIVDTEMPYVLVHRNLVKRLAGRNPMDQSVSIGSDCHVVGDSMGLECVDEDRTGLS